MSDFRISENFGADDSHLYATFEDFYVQREHIADTLPGTRISKWAVELARKPWACPAESLRAVQCACLIFGGADRIDWIRTRQRMVQSRAAAMEVDRIIRAALRGEPITTGV
jgi:hypothetical protein